MKTALTLILGLFPTLALAASGPPSVREIIWYVFVIIGVGIIFGLLHVAIDKAPFIDDTFKKAGKYLVILAAILIIIYIILGIIGI